MKKRKKWSGSLSSYMITFLIGSLMGVLLILFLSGRGGSGFPSLPPDTLTVMRLDTFWQTDTCYLTTKSGVAEPIVDTIYETPYFSFLPNWRIHEVDLRNQSLKVNAIKIKDGENPKAEVYSSVYYVPEGFHLKVRGDSIRVDTFSSNNNITDTILTKSKAFNWTLRTGAGFNSYIPENSKLRIMPYISIGGRLRIVEFKKFNLYWQITEINWLVSDWPIISTNLIITF